jgi:haloacetate dehalogenase
LFPGFTQHRAKVNGVEINFRRAGSGPPVLLLHGYPQTHAMWHAVAPTLARRFSVVTPDLRGYGDSGKPPSDPDHVAYSKRVMAQDMIELMAELGWRRFAVVGHDRGGRVAYRMALDAPDVVSKLAVLDILTTHTMWSTMNMASANAAYHWLFLAQPDGLPERLINHEREFYLRSTLQRWAGPGFTFAPETMAEYIRCFSTPEAVHAACEDYRAGATIDFQLDEADLGRRKIGCPVLALWGETGFAKRARDVIGAWKPWADDVRGGPIDCGHFVAEEKPAETLAGLEAFL